MRALYQSPGGGTKRNQKALKQEWHEKEDWFLFFNYFWDAVKAKFESTPLWARRSPLMIAVVLEQLQTVFLQFLNSTTGLTIEKISEPDDTLRRAIVIKDFKDIVDQYLKRFQEKNFAPWPEKSLNHKSGKDKLQAYFEKVRQDGRAKF